uniref:Uncharacterized AAA domain-containing protein ycf46 n=1 Tax=Rhizochromulina marina TaxID=1034831 RepID=A0A514CQ47_9STRA|nr:putative AAA domain-containing protein Ycf46 [Rhizochromulina marina]QDH81897.1 putative AAA domain-containing protein Ycf46 [Rhizochromulina marina]
MTTFGDEFSLILRARYPLVYIATQEEERVEYTLRQILKNSDNRALYNWDFVDGYTSNPNIKGFATKNPLQALDLIEKMAVQKPAIFILKDFNKFLTDISVTRKIKNIIRTLRLQPKTLVIIANEIEIPTELFNVFTIIEFNLPTPSEIRNELDRLFKCLNQEADVRFLETLTRACQGLTLEKIRQTLSKSLARYNSLNQKTIEVILNEKRQIVAKTQILDFQDVSINLQAIGGLNNLKHWLRIRKQSFSSKAELYGLPAPRGLLLAGVQGTGKSLTAKAIAGEWQLPLLQLDAGRLFDGIVGESERNVRQMIQLVEALSPCILWIDEIDKAFASNTQRTDSGTTNRVMSTLLTWLSEKQSPVFVVATANNFEALPLEVIRRGRFDEIFFVKLPDLKERKQIFSVVLNRYRPATKKLFDISKLSALANGFSGSEIEQVIIEAMHLAFDENREFTEQDILDSLDQMIPLSEIDPERTKEMEEWAKSGRLRIA